MGDTLRSMLLTSYAFWTLGTIALWAGWISLALAVLLALLGFVILRPKPVKTTTITEATEQSAS